MPNKFEGKTVIITGGSNGIGEGIAKAFGKVGAIVFIADLDDVRGEEVQKIIEEEGGRAFFYQTNVKKEEDIQRLIQQERSSPTLVKSSRTSG